MAYSIYMAKDNFVTQVTDIFGDYTGISDISRGVRTGDSEGILTGLDKLNPTAHKDVNPLLDTLIRSNSSFSGTDCTIVAQINNILISLGNVETFSYSIFREKMPVRTLGRSGPKGYTGGSRTIGGSLVFIVFDRHPLIDIVKQMKYNPRKYDSRSVNPVADQIAPIDLFLVFRNEYGHESLLKLYAVEFLQEGQTHSINDIYSENVTQYVARDIDIMINSDDVDSFRDLIFQRQLAGQFIDNYLSSMLDYKQNIERRISGIDKQLSDNTVKFTGFNFKKQKTQRDLDVRNLKSERSDLITELNTITNQISIYENNIRGWNAQHGDSLPAVDNLRQMPVNTSPLLDNASSASRGPING